MEVPYRVLEHKYGFRSDDENDRPETFSGNKIIHGDNLEALKSLLPQYEGRINCVYIDPPYNTDKEDWRYNDNVIDPLAPSTGYAAHVFRGGSWRSTEWDCRCTRANFWIANHKSNDLGSRLLCLVNQ